LDHSADTPIVTGACFALARVLRLDLNMELIPRLLHLDFSVDTVDVKFETGTDLWWTSVTVANLVGEKGIHCLP
jgi:hypothetical protein